MQPNGAIIVKLPFGSERREYEYFCIFETLKWHGKKGSIVEKEEK